MRVLLKLIKRELVHKRKMESIISQITEWNELLCNERNKMHKYSRSQIESTLVYMQLNVPLTLTSGQSTS